MEGGCQPEPEIAYPHLLFHVLDVEHRLDLLPHLPPGPCAQGQVLAEVPLYDLQGQPVGNICTLLTQTLNTHFSHCYKKGKKVYFNKNSS